MTDHKKIEKLMIKNKIKKERREANEPKKKINKLNAFQIFICALRLKLLTAAIAAAFIITYMWITDRCYVCYNVYCGTHALIPFIFDTQLGKMPTH